MALSNAKNATRALYTAIKAATFTDPQPEVWNGEVNVDHDPHDVIYVQPDADTPVRISQEWLGFGAGAQRRESIDIPLRIQVVREGTDPAEAEDRAWALAEAVAGVLAADQSLGGNVLSSLPADMASSVENFEDGRKAFVTMTVTCEARARGI